MSHAFRCILVVVLAVAFGDAGAASRPSNDGRHDFDWEHGRWRTHVKRLAQPLSGSREWVEYAGTTVVRPALGGRANVVELDVAGPAGRIEGISLRTLDPATGEWRLHYANVRDGQVGPPTIGRFVDGRGEFFGDETIGGKPIRVRFVIHVVSRDEARFEQAFSTDAGRTWEVNWIAVDRRAE
jgi:hypothetical protein